MNHDFGTNKLAFLKLNRLYRKEEKKKQSRCRGWESKEVFEEQMIGAHDKPMLSGC